MIGLKICKIFFKLPVASKVQQVGLPVVNLCSNIESCSISVCNLTKYVTFQNKYILKNIIYLPFRIYVIKIVQH